MLDVGPAEAVRVAHAARWPAVGIWFDPDSWSSRTSTDVVAALTATGCVALDIEPIILAPEGPLVSESAARLVDAGISVGARNILVASRDPDHGRVAATMAALCELVEGTEVRVVLEFLPIMAVRTLDEALAIVERADHRAAGVLIDVLHLMRSGGTIDDVAVVDPALLPYAQLCDVAADPPTDFGGLLDEALHGRLLPGDGVAPLRQLLAVLPTDCPLSLEMRSRQLMSDFGDPVERAIAVLASTGMAR
jgi:sugar phosphate isomerase/epimerase